MIEKEALLGQFYVSTTWDYTYAGLDDWNGIVFLKASRELLQAVLYKYSFKSDINKSVVRLQNILKNADLVILKFSYATRGHFWQVNILRASLIGHLVKNVQPRFLKEGPATELMGEKCKGVCFGQHK